MAGCLKTSRSDSDARNNYWYHSLVEPRDWRNSTTDHHGRFYLCSFSAQIDLGPVHCDANPNLQLDHLATD